MYKYASKNIIKFTDYLLYTYMNRVVLYYVQRLLTRVAFFVHRHLY